MDDLFPNASPSLVTYNLLPFVAWLKGQYPQVLRKVQLYGSVSEEKYELVHTSRIYTTVETLALDLTWQSDGLINVNQFCYKCGYGGNREGSQLRCFNSACSNVLAGPGLGLVYASVQESEPIVSQIEALVNFDALASIVWAQQLFEALCIMEKVLGDLSKWVPTHRYKTLAKVAI